MRRASAGPRSERGAFLIITTIGVVVAVIATALSVDLGRLAQEKRRDQKVADLAALDAVRDLGNRQALAEASALRNNFPTTAGYSIVADRGKMVGGSFVLDAAGDAVRVTATSPFENVFVSGSRTVSATAAAKVREDAGFSIGSSLARVDGTVQSPILNRILERLLGASSGSFTVDAVGYQGLSAASVTLGDLQGELGLGTVDELLDANLSVKNLLTATGTVLDNQGVLAAAQVNQMAAAASGSTMIRLRDMITVDQGMGEAAAAASINVLQLISGSAQLANKDTFLSVPNAGINVPVPGVGSTGNSLGLKVIEPPQFYFGPVGGSRTTSQVELTFTPTIDVGLSLPLPVGNLVKATGTLPVKVVAAGATGTLSDVICSGPGQGITVGVDTESVTTSASGTVDLKLVLDGAAAGTVNVQGTVTGANAPPTSLSFAWPGEFSPPASSKSTPGSPMNLAMTSTSTGNVVIDLGLVNVTLSADVVSQAVLDALNGSPSLLDRIRLRLGSQEFAALGIRVGIADVAATRDAFDPDACGIPGLVS